MKSMELDGSEPDFVTAYSGAWAGNNGDASPEARASHLELMSLKSAWQAMIRRCHAAVPGSKDFVNYQGRGIAVCKEWRESFDAFAAHIGPRPKPNLTIDRINNDGNYEPGNVRWATPREQVLNRRPPKNGRPFGSKISEIRVHSCPAQLRYREVLQTQVSSTRQLAKDMGVSPTATGNWAAGPFRPEAHHRNWLARRYGIPVNDWLTDAEFEFSFGFKRKADPQQ